MAKTIIKVDALSLAEDIINRAKGPAMRRFAMGAGGAFAGNAALNLVRGRPVFGGGGRAMMVGGLGASLGGSQMAMGFGTRTINSFKGGG